MIVPTIIHRRDESRRVLHFSKESSRNPWRCLNIRQNVTKRFRRAFLIARKRNRSVSIV